MWKKNILLREEYLLSSFDTSDSAKHSTYASLVDPHTYPVMHSEPVILPPPHKWRSIIASVGM